jgi:hypothetical protein
MTLTSYRLFGWLGGLVGWLVDVVRAFTAPEDVFASWNLANPSHNSEQALIWELGCLIYELSCPIRSTRHLVQVAAPLMITLAFMCDTLAHLHIAHSSQNPHNTTIQVSGRIGVVSMPKPPCVQYRRLSTIALLQTLYASLSLSLSLWHIKMSLFLISTTVL